VQRSRYRPGPRRLPELLTALAGVGAGALLFATAAADPANLYPSLSLLEWPQLVLLPVLAVALAAAPARLTPPPPIAAPAEPRPATSLPR
jgi:energy-coupling factor transport system permease protein